MDVVGRGSKGILLAFISGDQCIKQMGVGAVMPRNYPPKPPKKVFWIHFWARSSAVVSRCQSHPCLQCSSFPLSCRGWPLPTSTEDHFKLWVKEIFRQLCSSPCSHLFKARRQWRLSFYLSTGKFECSDQKIQACSLLSLSSFEWLHCEALTIMS